jgi:hypothetical protein
MPRLFVLVIAGYAARLMRRARQHRGLYSGHYRFHAAAVRASGRSGGADHCDWFCRPTISCTRIVGKVHVIYFRSPLITSWVRVALVLVILFVGVLVTTNADAPRASVRLVEPVRFAATSFFRFRASTRPARFGIMMFRIRGSGRYGATRSSNEAVTVVVWQ